MNKTDFAAWLATQSGVISERPHGSNDCPLAVWLRANGAPNPSVLCCRGYNLAGEARKPTPKWAQQFIIEIDIDDGPLSAIECLGILEKCSGE